MRQSATRDLCLGEPDLTLAPLKDKVRLGGQIVARSGRRLRRLAAMPSFALASLNMKPAERLLIAPQDIRTADPTIAGEIYSGYFALAGRVVNAHGRTPF